MRLLSYLNLVKSSQNFNFGEIVLWQMIAQVMWVDFDSHVFLVVVYGDFHCTYILTSVLNQYIILARVKRFQ